MSGRYRLLLRLLDRITDRVLHIPAHPTLGCECGQPHKHGLHNADRCWQFQPDVPPPVAPLHSPMWRGGAS